MPELTEVPVLALRGVTALAPDGTTLLDDVSFTAQRGSLVAVVGPTGAGKTSLARALTGSIPIAEGDVHVEGTTAFVPQHDVLHLGLSLRRALAYAASLRLPEATESTRITRVQAVMDELGLAAHANTIVRDLSVGQRKRASVAAQLLGDPDVIVLDEPTAGLDPGYERVVLNMLRDLAAGGRTVLIVTHTVDALRACDRVLFLAAGGSVAFYGPPAKAAKYFKLNDPADVFIALDTEPHKSWKDSFRASALYETYIAGPGRRVADTATDVIDRSGFGIRQVMMLVRRHFELLRSDRRHLAMLVLQGPIIGGLLWSVLPANGLVPNHDGTFGQHAAIVVMFLTLSVTWLGCTNAIREIVKERDIVRSEIAAGLSARSYVMAKAVSLGGMTMVQSIVIACIATARQHAPGTGAFLWSARVELILIAAAAGFAAATLGLALSAISKSADKALAFLPMTLVLQLVLAGAWAEDSAFVVLRGVRNFIGARWGMDAMAATLERHPGSFFAAMGALVGLSALAVAVATVRVAYVTRPATQPLPTVKSVWNGAVANASKIGVTAATALAVTVSLAAGGTGVVAIVHTHNASASHAEPTAIAAAANGHKTSHHATTVATTPTTLIDEVPVPTTTPVTTPVAVTTRKVQPVKEVVNTLTDTVDSVVQPVTDVLNTITTPTTTTPTTTPAPAPTAGTNKTNPWAKFFQMFNPFAPRVNQ